MNMRLAPCGMLLLQFGLGCAGTAGDASGEPQTRKDAGATTPPQNASTATTTTTTTTPTTTTTTTTTPGAQHQQQTPSLPVDYLAHEPLEELPKGDQQLAKICMRNNGDNVAKAFCAATPPVIKSITDLQALLGLTVGAGGNNNNNVEFALTGHSSSLVTRYVSAINPRAIIFSELRNQQGQQNRSGNFIAMGFVRGEQFVELVSRDPTANNNAGDLNFYLLSFKQACNDKPEGCSNGELLSPGVESNFTGYTLYQDVDIKNTIFDCLQCHQTGGPGTPKILRMQELNNPWMHWFRNNRVNGQVLLADYTAAHGTQEAYAGIPGNRISQSDPADLEDLVENQGFRQQPNIFNSNRILNEVRQANPQQPGSNLPKGTSATWQALYDAAKDGRFIPAPYHDTKVTDPMKLAIMTNAYKGVMAGTMPMAMMPDIRDVFLEEALSELQFRPTPNMNARQMLVQMCQHCHNSSLDQTISRARFDVMKLDTMAQAERDEAIKRITLPATAYRHMPPERFRTLSPENVSAIVEALRAPVSAGQ